jgi:SAM-dependent methyltransferase
LFQGSGYAFLLRPGAKTLILGAGGGWDAALALASGSRDVTAVEINPIIVEAIMRGRFLETSHHLYKRPEVRAVVEDGRSFVRRTDERFGLILATLVDTRNPAAAGTHALNESSIYTVEAFRDYLAHLSPGGLLAFTHWGFDPPRESLRLAALARAALESSGAREPWRHVIVLRSQQEEPPAAGALDTVIVSREPLPVDELERAALEAIRGGLEILYMPGQAQDSLFAAVLAGADPSSFLRTYRYDVRPVTDDRPFFFFTSRLDHWARPSAAPADPRSETTALNLFALLAVSLAATAVTLALPPLVLRARLDPAPGVRVFLLYFVCLGAGYVMVQVGLIQRLVMLLGHPTYALTVVIFAMLLWSGLGSFFSRRIIQGDDRRLMAVLGVSSVLVAVAALLLGPFAGAGAAWGLPWKMLATAALIAPPAFFMGMAFPAGLVRLDRWQPAAVKWAWSINAAASVLGSCCAVLAAVVLGLRLTLLVGAFTYLLALAAVAATRGRVPSAR